MRRGQSEEGRKPPDEKSVPFHQPGGHQVHRSEKTFMGKNPGVKQLRPVASAEEIADFLRERPSLNRRTSCLEHPSVLGLPSQSLCLARTPSTDWQGRYACFVHTIVYPPPWSSLGHDRGLRVLHSWGSEEAAEPPPTRLARYSCS